VTVFTGVKLMIVTIVTTIPRWRREKPVRSILLIISLCVVYLRTYRIHTSNKYGHALFYLAYCFYGQKIDVEKTARIGGWNWGIQRKPSTLLKSLTNFMLYRVHFFVSCIRTHTISCDRHKLHR